ncbi:MAG TPA: 3-oxoacyl-[acyl-carrier-protein] reductase [Candidatus Atribacteria bacterium]|jgi:3-oxoacyl-[acyl-carrier protein] reductase|uniref:3-oxoacyl-[acyl-carrier-protein] reductase n=1 Tax=Candidatus Sordicultor fermentans TaxID=1953203 RepID=UPI0016AB8AEA|nr:3-oxoacyl-[acyl-carrier-protein] reductase [Atribacterota bacterium]NLY05632.1 3-oxoacyl-[acyl-carrier-protein] reductase [Candidatus Atribacteria bacterium]MDI9608625.1 3-oxoacyl-[acyl-carrier-protein] reductase [Atribacterota bacterium]HOA99460.1 3-oxoacyl-[acyl-carrier-protein] reductase [Candidatus Atribacteria bacterium]HOQ50460.1 3-oxoacyl-[acyl-carrier-protein] reductase [Candidatus Atribacteria bacterium]
MSLENQVAMVTGGRRGIGFTIAQILGKNGARVAINDVASQEEIEKAVEELKEQGIEARGYIADVTKKEEIKTVVQDIINTWGQIDILVNNAGITRDALLVRMKDEDWKAVLEVGVQGVYYCTKEVLRYMMKKRYGRIINISSVVGVMGNAGQTNYSTAKAAILGFTKSLAREVASLGITVNAVAPGFINTEMTKKLPEEVREVWLQQVPLRRWGEPEEVAQVVAFLASRAAGYITGQTIHVNGGLVMI